MASEETKAKAKEVAALINGSLGADTIQFGDDERFRTRVIPTGVLPVDDLLQGGVPRGRWTEFYGNYSTLKSYIGYSAIASCQEEGGVAALVDTEHAWDAAWGERLGVDSSQLLLEQPATAELAVDVTEVMIRNGVDLVVWDSVAAMTPQAEANKREEGENADVASLARLMSRATRKLTSANSQTALVFINQTRDTIGVTFGSKESTPGGRALAFYASHRVRCQKGSKVTEKDDMYTTAGSQATYSTVQQKVKLELHKSKLTVPHREVWLVFDLKEGEIDEGGYILARGLQEGLITQKSGWWKLKGSSKKYRAGNLIDYIFDNDDVYERVIEELFPWASTT